MKKAFKSIYSLLFVILVVLTGLVSCFNLIKFYLNGEISYNEWTPEMGSKFETDLTSTFFGKIQFVNLNGAIRNLLAQPEMNGVVKLNNGYLTTVVDYCSDSAIYDYTNQTLKLKEYLDKRNIDLLYVATPYTSSKYDPQLPIGVEDYSNSNIDRLIDSFKNNGINTMDLRETMHLDGIDHYDMMYKTDHHWTTLAGFYAYCKLEDYIVNKIGCITDSKVSDIENYTLTTYPKCHLGSRGQRTGKYYAGIDDFTLILPNFDTSIQEVNGPSGSLKDVMINTAPLASKDYTSRYTYDNVLGNSYSHYINQTCPNSIKLLIITDSFSKAIKPFLSIGFKETYYLFNQELYTLTPEFIDSYSPDVVIILHYSDEIRDESYAFDFSNF